MLCDSKSEIEKITSACSVISAVKCMKKEWVFEEVAVECYAGYKGRRNSPGLHLAKSAV